MKVCLVADTMVAISAREAFAIEAGDERLRRRAECSV